MKIRIKGNSLRYRLTVTDIANLGLHGYVQESINFTSKTLVYVLKKTTANLMTADFIDDTITLFIPENMLEELVHTNKVGFADSNGPVQLLVEKDFTCLENVEEDQSDNYPNPLASK
jgi:hypothetical protein